MFRPTVNEVANDVKIGAVDAGIVWDATADQYPELDPVPIKDAHRFGVSITIGVLTSTRQPTAALRFARYLGARDKGLPVFERMGFPTVAVRDTMTVIHIDHTMAKATQSFAIGRQSKHKHLMRRLLDALRSAESKERFRQGGFQWIDTGAAP